MSAGANRAITLAVIVAAFLLTLQDAAVSIVLPAIARDLGMDMSAVGWAANAYALALAAPLLVTGRLVDAMGSRRLLVSGLSMMTAASLVAAVAPNALWLDLARAGQGLAAALIAPAGLALAASRAGRRGMGSCTGSWAAASAAALAAGPLIGGALAQQLGWRAIFVVSAALSGAAAAAVRSALPSRDTAWRLDIRRGDTLAGAAIVAFTLGMTEGPRLGWRSPGVLALGVVAVACLCCVVVLQRHASHPVVAREVTRSKGFAGAALVTLLATAVMCSVLFFLALYLQMALGLSALGAGLALLPMTLVIVAGTPIAGRIADAIGPATPASAGMGTLAAALLLLALLGPDGGLSALMPLLAVAGAGVSLVTAPTTAAALASVPAEVRGAAAGALNSARMTGLVLGVAFMSAVAAGRLPQPDAGAGSSPAAHGLMDALLINAAVAAGVAILAPVVLRRRWARHDKPRRVPGIHHWTTSAPGELPIG